MLDPAPFAAETGDKTGLTLGALWTTGTPKSAKHSTERLFWKRGRVSDLECRTAGNRPFLILEQLCKSTHKCPGTLRSASLVMQDKRMLNARDRAVINRGLKKPNTSTGKLH
ncbi:UNVERIFIED_CONTAM: hypothetical protein K2H54_043588 [Gekko kuhli]